MSLNKILLIGNVGKDPEIRMTKDNRKVANFSLCVSEKYKDKNGESKQKDEWFRIVAFGDGLAGIVENYIKSGTKLYIEGSLQTRKWTNDAGIEQIITEVVLQGYNNKIDILSAPRDHKTGSIRNDDNSDILNDDIPF